MVKESLKRIKGLKKLLHDGVERGTDFIEKHHRHAAEKPFQVLESIAPIAAPTKVVHIVYNGVLTFTYGSIRATNQITAKVDDWVMDTLVPPNDGKESDNSSKAD